MHSKQQQNAMKRKIQMSIDKVGVWVSRIKSSICFCQEKYFVIFLSKNKKNTHPRIELVNNFNVMASMLDVYKKFKFHHLDGHSFDTLEKNYLWQCSHRNNKSGEL